MPVTKPYYEDYATHALRFYARNPALNMKSPGLKLVDIENWNACNDTMRKYSERDQAIILNVFKSKCALSDAVECIAAQYKMNAGNVWQLLNRFSADFAINRGLI